MADIGESEKIEYVLTEYIDDLNSHPADALKWSSWFNENGIECANATYLFSERLPFMNCYVYPNISRALSQGTFSTSANIETALVSNTTLAQDVTAIISDCLIGLCGTLSYCENTRSCLSTSLLLNESTLSAQATYDCWNSICSQQTFTATPDIAGIGVSGPS